MHLRFLRLIELSNHVNKRDNIVTACLHLYPISSRNQLKDKVNKTFLLNVDQNCDLLTLYKSYRKTLVINKVQVEWERSRVKILKEIQCSMLQISSKKK